MKMKYDAISLIGSAAASLARKDGGTAYALYELADNLATIMRGEAPMESFLDVYTGEREAPFIRDGKMPGEKGYTP